MRQAVFDLFSREDLTEAMARIESLARPQDDQYFKELRAQHRRLRFMPSLLRTISFGAAPAGRPILDAIEYLRNVVDGVTARFVQNCTLTPHANGDCLSRAF